MMANRSLESATQAKTDFLANMSHEIRTPMNAILGFAQLLRRDPTLTAEQRERLDIINTSGEFLLVLINDILEMSKIEAGRATANPSAFDLARASLRSSIQSFRGRAESKGLRFAVEPGADLPRYVVTDKAKLRQILINLLSNAVKFTDSGFVVLKATASDRSAGQPLLTFEVEDTGAGIAHDELDLLFDHFVQTGAGRRAGPGPGWVSPSAGSSPCCSVVTSRCEVKRGRAAPSPSSCPSTPAIRACPMSRPIVARGHCRSRPSSLDSAFSSPMTTPRCAVSSLTCSDGSASRSRRSRTARRPSTSFDRFAPRPDSHGRANARHERRRGHCAHSLGPRRRCGQDHRSHGQRVLRHARGADLDRRPTASSASRSPRRSSSR